jgi:hypothetical protein
VLAERRFSVAVTIVMLYVFYMYFVEAAYKTTFEGYGSATRHPCSTLRLHVLLTF